MRRRRSSKAVAGVAGGLADHLGVEVFWVRVAFALLAAFAGLGVVAYGLLWMFVPQESARVPVREQTAKERQQAVGLVALGLGLAVVAGLLQGCLLYTDSAGAGGTGRAPAGSAWSSARAAATPWSGCWPARCWSPPAW